MTTRPKRRRPLPCLVLRVPVERRHLAAYRESRVLPLEVLAAVVRAIERGELESALGGGE